MPNHAPAMWGTLNLLFCPTKRNLISFISGMFLLRRPCAALLPLMCSPYALLCMLREGEMQPERSEHICTLYLWAISFSAFRSLRARCRKSSLVEKRARVCHPRGQHLHSRTIPEVAAKTETSHRCRQLCRLSLPQLLSSFSRYEYEVRVFHCRNSPWPFLQKVNKNTNKDYYYYHFFFIIIIILIKTQHDCSKNIVPFLGEHRTHTFILFFFYKNRSF